MFIALALVSAAFYGAADFLGGLASKRAATVFVAFLSQFAGLIRGQKSKGKRQRAKVRAKV